MSQKKENNRQLVLAERPVGKPTKDTLNLACWLVAEWPVLAVQVDQMGGALRMHAAPPKAHSELKSAYCRGLRLAFKCERI